MSRNRKWKVIACGTCHEEVVRFSTRDGRMHYAYSGRALHLPHPDKAEPSMHDKSWFGFDLEETLVTGPEWLEVVCKCNAREGTHTTVELGAAYAAAQAAPGRVVLLGDVAQPR